MYHRLREFAINIIKKSSLEPFAREVYGMFVPSKGNQYDKETFELMRKELKVNSNCIDVGAYRGEILRNIVKIAPKGKHFAFEPIPENYKYLANRFQNVSIFNIALSDQSGEVVFQHVIGRPARSGIKRVTYPDKNQKIQEIQIKIDSLDRVIPEKTPIDFIKIDVEGAELEVLKGARRLITTYKPLIVFEHELEKCEPYGSTPSDIYKLLVDELGMKISLMKNYLQNEPGLTRDQFVQIVEENSDFYFIAHN